MGGGIIPRCLNSAECSLGFCYAPFIQIAKRTTTSKRYQAARRRTRNKPGWCIGVPSAILISIIEIYHLCAAVSPSSSNGKNVLTLRKICKLVLQFKISTNCGLSGRESIISHCFTHYHGVGPTNAIAKVIQPNAQMPHPSKRICLHYCFCAFL